MKLTYPIRVENKEIQLTRYCRSVWVCDRNRSFLSIYEEVWMVQGHHVLWWSFSRDKMLSSSCLDVPNIRFHLCVQKVLQSMKLGRCLLPCIACVQSFGRKKISETKLKMVIFMIIDSSRLHKLHLGKFLKSLSNF